MAVIQIKNFAGEVPRLPARALGGNGAQANENLLATATEFRPLMGDASVAPGLVGAKTLYRLSRNADGSLRANDDTSGWIVEAAEKNYVKGQLNDDATERTAVTWADGTQAPRVIDAKGADRVLGVPKPPKPGVTLVAVAQFTMDDALTWLSKDLIPALKTALSDRLIEARVSGGQSVAGSTSLFGMSVKPDEPWLVYKTRVLSDAQALGLTSPELAGWDAGGGQWAVNIELLPMWGRVTDKPGLKTAVQAITLPSGDAAFTSEQADKLTDKLAALFDPEGDSLKARRTDLTAQGQKFSDLMSSVAGAATPRPVEPTKPAGPEFVSQPDEGYVRTPAWVQYDADMAAYRAALADWQAAGGAQAQSAADTVAALQTVRIRAEALSNDIEAEYFRRKDKIGDLIQSMIDGEPLFGGEDGEAMIKVDPDRIIDTRFYVATYVTDWGEESQPSEVSEMLEVDQNDQVTVTVAAPPAGRNVQKWRLYRSNVGSQSAAFQFVDEFLATTLSYTDALKGEQLGEPCPTFTWAEPPVRLDQGSAAAIKPPKGPDPYLRGLVGMPNGILAGFIDNYVAFCHPYHPYAWPVEYQITTEHPIVGLGAFGQTLFVGTMGHPYLISGADSASMSAQKLPHFQACVARRSIVGVGDGVVYASPDGLCLASARGVEVLTQGFFSREDWQALNPGSIVAAEHEGVYYFWTGAGCWALDFLAKKLGRVTDAPVTAVCRDILADHLFAAVGANVVKLFAGGRREGRWRSGTMVMQAQAPLAWVQADGDQSPSNPVQVHWYGDGQLRYTAVLDGIEPKRLPPGRWLEQEVEVVSRARLTKVFMATSTAELKGAD